MLDEDGWRQHSPSRVRQLFVKGGAHVGELSWSLALTHANNDLIGNGLLPESMLAQDRSQVYTRPDQTRTKMSMLSFNAQFDVSATQQLAATAYPAPTRAAPRSTAT